MPEATVLPPPDGLVYGVTVATLFAVVSLMWGYVRARRVNGRKAFTPIQLIAMGAAALVLAGGFTAAWGITCAPIAIAFGWGLVLSLVSPPLAVIHLVCLTLLRPWEVLAFPAMGIIPKLSAGVCLLSWGVSAIRGRGFGLLLSTPVKLFIAFAVWILVSALLGGDFDAGLAEYRDSFMIITIIFLMIVNLLSTADELRTLIRALVVTAVGVVAAAVIGTVELAGFNPSIQRLQVAGLLGNSNDLAALIVLCMPLLVIPWMTAPARRGGILIRLLTFFSAGLFLVGLWLAQSRGAFIGLFGGIAAFMIVRSKRPLRGLLYSAAFVPVLYGVLGILKSIRASDDMNGSTESRMNYILAGLNMALHHPFTGVGFGNYPKLFESYAPAIDFEWGQRTAHNTWVLALAETGLPGFCLIVAIFVLSLKAAWQIRGAWPELVPSLVAYGIAMSFLSHTYTILPYLIFAIIQVAVKCHVPALDGELALLGMAIGPTGPIGAGAEPKPGARKALVRA